ncbi:MAG: hypothetical protein ABJA81_08930 [Nocardioidaceae bacterium]
MADYTGSQPARRPAAKELVAMLGLITAALLIAMAAWAFLATKEKPAVIRVEDRTLDTVDERLVRGPKGYVNP